MRDAGVKILDTFEDCINEASIPATELELIVARVQRDPSCGHFWLPLYEELGKLPMGGFYVNSHRFKLNGTDHEGHTLKLYLSARFPVQLWLFSTKQLHDLPWAGREQFLLERGRAIHRAFVVQEA